MTGPFTTYPGVDASLNFPDSLRTAMAAYPEILAAIAAKRNFQSFTWPNQAAMDSQTGMTDGDLGYQATLDQHYGRENSVWVPMSPAFYFAAGNLVNMDSTPALETDAPSTYQLGETVFATPASTGAWSIGSDGLTVLSVIYAPGSRGWQIAIQKVTGDTWTRAINNSGGWSAWHRVAKAYRWGSSTDMNNEVNMAIGELGFRTDTSFTMRYNGTAWKEWESYWQTIVPTVTGFSGASGANPGWIGTARWRWNSGRVLFQGNVYVNGGSGSVTGQIGVTLPNTADIPPGTQAVMIGEARIIDDSLSLAYRAWARLQNSTTLNFDTLTTATASARTPIESAGPAKPIAWAQTDSLSWNVIYDVAM